MSARPWFERAQMVLRIGLAGFLGFQAMVLLIEGRGMFVHLGYPDGGRVGLAVAEVAAAILTILPATFFAGAVGLIGVLAWAAGFHFGLHRRADSLFVYMALLALLMVARGWSVRRRPESAP